METNVRYKLIGIFVIVMIAVISIAIIWLSSGLSFQGFKTYKVYMQESVTGLSRDASVEYNGVDVGTVSSIKINHKNPRLVELLLKVQDNTPITMGTRAKLEVKMLTGVANIALEDKGLNMTPLKILPGQDYPVISTVPSFLLRLDTVITQLNASFRQLSFSIRSLLDDENLRTIKESLANFRKFTGTLAENSEQISDILQDTSKSMKILQRQTLPDANQMMLDVSQVMRSLTQLTDEIKQNPSVLIRGKATRQPGPGE